MVHYHTEESLETGLSTNPSGEQWVVVHTRSRCEKKLCQECEHRGIFVYLPLRKRIHHYGGRRREFESPLFPGYIFSRAQPEGKAFLKGNQYTARVLDVPDQKTLGLQLEQIRNALASSQELEIMPFLREGREVRVISGPLKGMEGIVLRIGGKSKIVINVDMIQQSVAMEIDAGMLSPA